MTISFSSFGIVAIINAALALLLLGWLAFDWSYTDTTFGGHLGFLLPIVLGIWLFVMGRLSTHS